MTAVLGIDAAWTVGRPSGVALVAREIAGWRLIAVAASYAQFFALTDGTFASPGLPLGSRPDALALLKTAEKLSGGSVDLIAIDMPLAHSPIVGRRASDNDVSRAYGSRKCGTHSPSRIRPGSMSDDLVKSFAGAGYPLRVRTPGSPGLIEVYPHPALVELARAPQRLPYKSSKIRAYWPTLTQAERRERLYEQWRTIVTLLESEISGIAAALPPLEPSASTVSMKAYEDMLDAVVCAWVGICVFEGRATAYGDDDSAIWIPTQGAPETIT